MRAMARSIPPDRLAQLVDAATATFIALGYRRTQMADVAERLGIAKGTLYGYVESKEAMFDAALRYADRPELVPDTTALPLPTPARGATIRYVRSRLAAEAGDLVLVRVMSGGPSTTDIEGELESIVVDLFRRIARNRRVIKLVDRCSIDYPELARVWFGEGRSAQSELLRAYLERRIAERRLRKVPSAAIAARAMLETIAFWAMHRHWDPAPQPIEEAEVERSVVDLLARGLVEVQR
jgi:AcrR family transcriptional regulator